MSEGSVWERIPALAVRTLLEALHAARVRSFEDADVGLPVITVMTKSGHTLQGYLLAYDAKTQDVVIEELATARVTADLAYLSAHEIAVVRVQQALDRIDVLTRGEAELAPRAEVPTTLEIRREAAATFAAIAERVGHPLALEVDWAPLADDDARRHSARELLTSFARVVESLLDEFGDSALGEVRRVVVEPGDAVDAAVDGDAVVLRADLARGRRGRMTDRGLKEALERAL